MLKKILVGLLVLAVVAVVVGFLLPSRVDVDRSVVIAASAEAIHPHIDTLVNWRAWSPCEDATIVYTYAGPPSGVGASCSWTSEDSGDGSLEITESDPQRHVRYKMSFDGGKTWSGSGAFEYSASGAGTEVHWKWDWDCGTNLFYRYMMLAMSGHMQEVTDSGLANLKEVVEKAGGK
jgi:hypothetical protein